MSLFKFITENNIYCGMVLDPFNYVIDHVTRMLSQEWMEVKWRGGDVIWIWWWRQMNTHSTRVVLNVSHALHESLFLPILSRSGIWITACIMPEFFFTWGWYNRSSIAKRFWNICSAKNCVLTSLLCLSVSTSEGLATACWTNKLATITITLMVKI